MMTIREATIDDLDALRDLYFNHLVETPPMVYDGQKMLQVLREIVKDDHYHLLVGENSGRIVSSVTLVVIQNLTHDARPYAIIENVVTRVDCRGLGFATALMEKAAETAKAAGCYKIMLMTGSKKESTHCFYEKCGYNRIDKTGYIQWL